MASIIWEVYDVTNIEKNLFAIIAAKPRENMEKHTAVDIQNCSSFFMLIVRSLDMKTISLLYKAFFLAYYFLSKIIYFQELSSTGS